MQMFLSRSGRTWNITDLVTETTLSGDKNSMSRQLAAETAVLKNGLVPKTGDLITLSDGGAKRFLGIILTQEEGSEDNTETWVAFDDGYYLSKNDGTYKFKGATPDAITRRACADKKVPVASLPGCSVKISRKFAGVPLNQIIATAWTLAGKKTGKKYAYRYTPAGLIVKTMGVSARNLVLKPKSNLMDAATRIDASQMVNSVAIYNAKGNFIRRIGDAQAQKLYGVMEKHVTQEDGKTGAADAAGDAGELLEDGKLQKTVTVNIHPGDSTLMSGDTVIVREPKTGLSGVFWVEGDVTTWKNKNVYTRLTLNYRCAMETVKAGSDLN